MGHAEAQYRLGLLYARGEGMLQSLPDAVAWYQRAAEQGQAEAQFQLGLIHLNGVKAASGPYSPENWLRAATHRDRTATQETFDLLFPNGVEVTADAEAAIAWISRLAKSGKAEGQAVLADLLRHGRGCPQNYEEARRLYLLAGKAWPRPSSRLAIFTIRLWVSQLIPKWPPNGTKRLLTTATSRACRARLNASVGQGTAGQ